MFNFLKWFKKDPPVENIVLAKIVNELLDALRDDHITKTEIEELRKRSYEILIDLNLDKIIKKGDS